MSESSDETLSDVVARRIVQFRKRRDLTREQLAALCAELQYPALTGPALANIETGRRNADGQRRRDVTVDELMVLAKALRVPPTLLMFPVGEVEAVPLRPGETIDPWAGVKWVAGEAYPGEDVAEHWAVPIYLFREHDRLRLERLELMADQLFAPKDEDETRKRSLEIQEFWIKLKNLRAEFRRHGLTPPAAVEDLEGIDDQPRLYLTPEQVEERLARGVEVRDISRPGDPRPMKVGEAATQAEAIAMGRKFVAEYLARQERASVQADE